LLNYYPSEWVTAFLDKEPEDKKERAISTVARLGFDIIPLDINKSDMQWKTNGSPNKLVQPFTSIKGLGEKAIEQILENRPFNSIEELLFNEKIAYNKLNKKALDALVKSQTLDSLIDDRFTGSRHFWAAVADERTKSKKKFYENIERLSDKGSFEAEEVIENLVNLTGIFPIDLVMSEEIKKTLIEYSVPTITEFDGKSEFVWFIPREVQIKKTSRGAEYMLIRTTDSSSGGQVIKCWGQKDPNAVRVNRPYLAKLDYDEKWGFSTRNVRRAFTLLN
jgi:DNA polymerase III alpha subunit